MSALGETFRTARESQGLTLADVAERIHIRSVYLEAMEAEHWQAIGPAVYVRGFIRTYARFLGLDPDAALARFAGTSATGAPAPSVVLAPSPRGEPSRSGLPRGEPARPRTTSGTEPGRRLSPWALAALAVAAMLVLFAGWQYYVYSQTGGKAEPGGSVQAQLPPAAAPAPGAARNRARAAAPELSSPGKNTAKSSGFAVRLKDSSWLRVVVDGKVAMEGLYPSGTTRSFAGRSATVRVGNAGGVDITVDGKDLGPMGGLGDVAERSFQL